jgi:predicted ATPase
LQQREGLIPLELPGATETETPAHLRQNEAVMLFMERAAAAAGKFELNDQEEFQTQTSARCSQDSDY